MAMATTSRYCAAQISSKATIATTNSNQLQPHFLAPRGLTTAEFSYATAPFQVRLMHETGYELGNLDATLILQRPKLSPHKEAITIRANLCELLGADPSVFFKIGCNVSFLKIPNLFY